MAGRLVPRPAQPIKLVPPSGKTSIPDKSGQLPPWLLQRSKGKGAAAPINVSLKGKGGPLAVDPTGNIPAPLQQRSAPAWLVAAQQRPGVSITKPHSGRQRVTQSRIPGIVTEWNGTMGFVLPEKPIVHPDAKKNPKGLHLSKADVVPEGHKLETGMQVTCFAYTDGMKLGAERCMEFKGSLLGEDKPPEPKEPKEPKKGSLGKGASSKSGKGTGKPFGSASSSSSGSTYAEPGYKGGQKGVWVFQPQWSKEEKRPGKDGGQRDRGFKKQEGKGKSLPRSRVSTLSSLRGKCEKWEGTHGWIKPDEPVDHPKASKHKGLIYVHQKDIIEIPTLYTGQEVNFHVYEDSSGLGAEECIAC